jgi:hypothetical protein
VKVVSVPARDDRHATKRPAPRSHGVGVEQRLNRLAGCAVQSDPSHGPVKPHTAARGPPLADCASAGPAAIISSAPSRVSMATRVVMLRHMTCRLRRRIEERAPWVKPHAMCTPRKCKRLNR